MDWHEPHLWVGYHGRDLNATQIVKRILTIALGNIHDLSGPVLCFLGVEIYPFHTKFTLRFQHFNLYFKEFIDKYYDISGYIILSI